MLGLSSVSKHSAVSFRRQTKTNFTNYLDFVHQWLPTVTDSEFKSMLKILNPTIQNSFLQTINSAAHRFTIAEARQSTRKDSHPHLAKWVDVLAASGENGESFIDDVAFENAFPFSNEVTEQHEELIALINAIKVAPDDAKLKYAELAHEINRFRIKKNKSRNKNNNRRITCRYSWIFFQNYYFSINKNNKQNQNNNKYFLIKIYLYFLKYKYILFWKHTHQFLNKNIFLKHLILKWNYNYKYIYFDINTFFKI